MGMGGQKQVWKKSGSKLTSLTNGIRTKEQNTKENGTKMLKSSTGHGTGNSNVNNAGERASVATLEHTGKITDAEGEKRRGPALLPSRAYKRKNERNAFHEGQLGYPQTQAS